jgi:DNA-directed RNA polymerase specialized sigma24 family protein
MKARRDLRSSERHKKQPRKGNMRQATRSEKLAALNALTSQDYGKLLRFAEFTAMKFGGRVYDADAEDLLHEAIARALDDGNIRKWCSRKIDISMFLKGCIRSIASHWCKRARNTELPNDFPSPTRHDMQIEAAVTIAEIRQRLESRPEAVEIFDLKCLRFTAKEIQERLGISPNVYAAAVKWIARAVKRRGYRNEKASLEPRKFFG